MSERVTVPECGCAASKFIGGTWQSCVVDADGETRYFAANGVCWRCRQALGDGGAVTEMVPVAVAADVEGTWVFKLLVQGEENQGCLEENAATVLTALRQSGHAAELRERAEVAEKQVELLALELCKVECVETAKACPTGFASHYGNPCRSCGECPFTLQAKDSWLAWSEPLSRAALGLPAKEAADADA